MLHYQIEFDDYKQHLIHVTLRFLAHPNQVLWLPTWIPGSYLIREFAKHIESVKASDEAGRALNIAKFEKNKWRLFNTDHELITVEYDVYAYDLSVRGAYVDQNLFYVNPACACLGLEGQEDVACEVDLFLPEAVQHFTLATGLAAKSHVPGRFTLKANNYMQLIDSPFELAVQDRISFQAGNIPHEFTVSGQHQTNLERLKTDLEKICQAEIDLFGSAPFSDYVFMTIATGNHYGGLEHPNSTSLITPRDDLPKYNEPDEPSAAYQRFLGLCSHEYFHSWLVKYIRPENFTNYNLHSEGYTTLLWIFEGFTSYYDDLILLRSGVISQQSYLKLLKAQIDRYIQNPGRYVQTVTESSFDTWIKFYRPDENSNNAGTSYYNKGALVALCLDLTLRQHGSSLDAVMRRLYENAQQGQQVHDQTIYELCKELTGQDLTTTIDSFIYSTNKLPFIKLLTEFGVEVELDPHQSLAFGAKITEKPEGLLVQQVRRASSAAEAGLSAHDVIVAINSVKASDKLFTQAAKGKDALTLHVFRRDELLELRIQPDEVTLMAVKLSIADAEKINTWLKV